jgi:hypothetical protein
MAWRRPTRPLLNPPRCFAGAEPVARLAAISDRESTSGTSETPNLWKNLAALFASGVIRDVIVSMSHVPHVIELLLLERYAAYCVKIAQDCKPRTGRLLRLLAADLSLERDKHYRLLMAQPRVPRIAKFLAPERRGDWRSGYSQPPSVSSINPQAAQQVATRRQRA